MALLDRLQGLAAKIESSYNTDPTVAEATDSIQTSELDVIPLDGEFITRNLDTAHLGAEGEIIVASRCQASCNVEIAGAGAAGGIPEFDQLLRSSGFAATNAPLVDTQYDLVSTAFESLWFEVNKAGTQHIGGGAYCNMVINLAARGIPQMAFTLQGLYVAPTAVALPNYTLTNFQIPEAFNNENTITAKLDSIDIEVESMTIDLQNQIEHMDVPNFEEMLLVQRQVRGQVQFIAPTLAVKDWFVKARAAGTSVLVLQHGDTAGNIYEIDAPAVQITNPRYVESRGVLMLALDLLFTPAAIAGNDELKITIK